MSKINKLYTTLSNSNLNPYWIEDENGEQTEELCVSVNGTDYIINESAAPNMFGVKASTPFEEPEYYALDESGVMALFQ